MRKDTGKPAPRPLPRNGLRPTVAKWASQAVAQERQWAKDGTLARMYRDAAKKRRQLTESGNEHDEQ